MELMCDNTAAIVLATGEGSWRTKSAANKAYAVKEKVDCGKLVLSYVSTVDQCADSLTKFLRGGQDQLRARSHLSLVDLEDWLSRRGLITKASGVQNFSDQMGAFGPKLAECFFRNRLFRVRFFRARRVSLGLDLSCWLEGKKRLCLLKMENFSHL